MASSGNDPPHSNGINNASSDDKSLEGFITSQLAEQSVNRGENPGENIDEKKTNRFLSRAVSESKRMNKEVAKSEAKMSKLHAELGVERFSAWRQEHSFEVFHQKSQPAEMTHAKK